MLPASEEQRRRLSVHAGSSLGVARLARSTWQKSAQTSNRRIHQKSLLMSLASHALHAKGVTCETNFKVESLSIPAVTVAEKCNIRHPSSVIRHPSSVIRHPSSVICHRHLSSVTVICHSSVMGVACLLASAHVF